MAAQTVGFPEGFWFMSCWMSINDTPGFRLTIITQDCTKLWPTLDLHMDLCELVRGWAGGELISMSGVKYPLMFGTVSTGIS